MALPLWYHNEGNNDADHDDHQHDERGLNTVGHHDTSPPMCQVHITTKSIKAAA